MKLKVMGMAIDNDFPGKKFIYYFIVTICFLLLISHVALNFQDTADKIGSIEDSVLVFNDNWLVKARDKTNKKNIITADLSDRSIIMTQMTKKIPDMENIDTMVIYGRFDSISVYIANKLIYTFGENESFFYKNNYGTSWVSLPIKEEYKGENISIFFPENSPYLNSIDDIFLGEKSIVFYSLIRKYTPILAIGITTLACAWFNFIMYFVLRAGKEKNTMQLYVAATLFCLGIWVIFSTALPYMIFNNRSFVTNTWNIALYSTFIPMALYMSKADKRVKNSKMEYFVVVFSILAIIVFSLKLFGIYSFREIAFDKFYILVIYLLLIIFLSGTYLYENNKLIPFSTMIILFLLIIVSSEIIYFLKYGRPFMYSLLLGVVFFSIYMTQKAISSSISKLSEYERAKYYELLSTEDVMTGFKNQNAYLTEIKDLKNIDASGVFVAFVDMNNLKKLNDKYGHSIGDEAIVECIRSIYEAFDGEGSFYRIGGDEFLVIGRERSGEDLDRIRSKLDEILKTKSEKNGYEIGLALGYAFFDNKLDATIMDTIDRADKNMYVKKKEMKEEKN